MSTTVFLRDEAAGDGAPFVTVEHGGSITLQNLIEDYDCSCVVECDASGRAQPRSIIIDDPTEVLHRGAFYLTRSKTKKRDRDDAKDRNEADKLSVGIHLSGPTTAKAVHFNTRVAVREYSLPVSGEGLHGSPSEDGRPSIDLFAFGEPKVENSQTTMCSSGKSDLCFKAFTVTNPFDGAPTVVTLDVFREIVKVSKARLEGAADRHREAMREIQDSEDFISRHTAAPSSSQQQPVAV